MEPSVSLISAIAEFFKNRRMPIYVVWATTGFLLAGFELGLLPRMGNFFATFWDYIFVAFLATSLFFLGLIALHLKSRIWDKDETIRTGKEIDKSLNSLTEQAHAILGQFFRIQQKTMKIEGQESAVRELISCGFIACNESHHLIGKFPVSLTISHDVWDRLQEKMRRR